MCKARDDKINRDMDEQEQRARDNWKTIKQWLESLPGIGMKKESKKEQTEKRNKQWYISVSCQRSKVRTRFNLDELQRSDKESCLL